VALRAAILDLPVESIRPSPPELSAALLSGDWHLVYQMSDYTHKMPLGKGIDEE
jgi:hypothetical protein